jgi:hypothetical protein
VSSQQWPNLLRNGYSFAVAHPLPEMDTPGHIDTQVSITVEKVTGAPTTAQLQARFEVLQQTTGGAITGSYPGGLWTPLDADLHPNLLPDGDWPATIADQTTTALAIDKVITTNASTAISIGSGGAQTAPFVVGQRLSGSAIAYGSSNRVLAIGSAGFAGTSGSSGTLEFPAISTDTLGIGVLSTNPVTVMRRIAFAPFWRVVLTPTFTGGSSPALVVSVSTLTRY